MRRRSGLVLLEPDLRSPCKLHTTEIKGWVNHRPLESVLCAQEDNHHACSALPVITNNTARPWWQPNNWCQCVSHSLADISHPGQCGCWPSKMGWSCNWSFYIGPKLTLPPSWPRFVSTAVNAKLITQQLMQIFITESLSDMSQWVVFIHFVFNLDMKAKRNSALLPHSLDLHRSFCAHWRTKALLALQCGTEVYRKRLLTHT